VNTPAPTVPLSTSPTTVASGAASTLDEHMRLDAQQVSMEDRTDCQVVLLSAKRFLDASHRSTILAPTV
jgi:hypothetical protein